ncbi:thioesterase family protein [Intrasporangium sp. YIM S08009]|uniref:acyl-CoA thioesterase n=1 Tax=Intrasporangium zincisolvens TaxID=3080018 RepID=UPI002B05B968|nr:thioesterase family protein [Intrasporangium sp. YIM S08009]
MSAHRAGGVVRFSETDASGRFHHTAALTWAENAEHELYRAAGLAVEAFPRRAVSATFERPLEHGDAYVVELAVAKVGTSSITWTWRVLHDGSVAVTGAHSVVHVDPAGRPTPVPGQLRRVLETHLDSGTVDPGP